MKTSITEKTFFRYIKCPHWVYFDIHEEERKVDPLIEQLADDQLLPEKRKELIKNKKFVEVQAEDLEEAFNETMDYMRKGEQTIYSGVLMHDNYVGHPDVLEKVEGRSELGNYYYVASDFKRCQDVWDVYKFQGLFYADLLQRIQGVKPVQGYVVNHDGKVFSYLNEEFQERYDLALKDIENIVKGARPAPFLTSGCKQSPWFDECQKEAVICDDLSLINRIFRKEKKALNEAGLEKVTELAHANLDMIAKDVSRISRTRLEWLQQQAIALVEKKHFIMDQVILPEAKEEIYFDIESDPLRDTDYLFGVMLVKGDKTEYQDFLAKKLDGEKLAWEEFCHFISKHPKAPIYHYGWYEVGEIEKMITRYGAADKVIQILRENMIDLLIHVRENIIFPLYHYSLKDIARYIGFDWRDTDASGINSVLWYHQWADTGLIDKMQRIVDYNEDDCRATWELKKWLHEHA